MYDIVSMLKQSLFFKVRVWVPVAHTAKVRDALCLAGAGEQGNYDCCSTTYSAQGRFRPLIGAHPAIGEVGELTVVEENIIEVLCHESKVETVLQALRQAHPYEEPAIDILPRYELE